MAYNYENDPKDEWTESEFHRFNEIYKREDGTLVASFRVVVGRSHMTLNIKGKFEGSYYFTADELKERIDNINGSNGVPSESDAALAEMAEYEKSPRRKENLMVIPDHIIQLCNHP